VVRFVAGGKRNAHRRLILGIVVAALATAVFATSSAARGGRSQGGPSYSCRGAHVAPAEATLHFLRSSVLCLVNRVRRHYELPPLRFNDDLRRSATDHSDDMVRNGYFSHFGSDGSTPEGRIARSGYLAGASGYFVGEDIAGGEGLPYGSPLAIFRSWMHSPPHRANILDRRFSEDGVGVARGFPYGGGRSSATYTIDFGRRE
jgi:uncharacterized protein YkwD